MKNNIEIVSDGTGCGTKVSVGGVVINGVTQVDIQPLKANGIVTAVLTVDMVCLRMNI